MLPGVPSCEFLVLECSELVGGKIKAMIDHGYLAIFKFVSVHEHRAETQSRDASKSQFYLEAASTVIFRTNGSSY
jgi:hypothetical protein